MVPVKVRAPTWLSGSGREAAGGAALPEGGSLEWRLGTGLGKGSRRLGGENWLTNPLCSGCRWQMRGRMWGRGPAFPWLRRCNGPCPPSEGCPGPAPQERRAVAFAGALDGGGAAGGLCSLSGPKAREFGFHGKMAYQRLIGAGGTAGKGQPDSRDPVSCW